MIALRFDNSKVQRKKCLIIYDVSDDRLRTKMARYLEGFGQRVQKSAFEVCLSNSRIREIETELGKYALKGADIRIYELHLDNNVLTYNSADPFAVQDVIIC